MQLPSIFKDARYFQILFQAIFLSYGIYFLQWSNEYWLYCSYFITCIATQFFCEIILSKNKTLFFKRLKNGVPSAIISAFGLSLLLKTNDVNVALLAAVITIASKFILRINGKHIFNPSALGIVVAILFTGKAWFSPGQWGSNTVLLFGVMVLGFIVLTKIQKLDVSFSFLGVFGALLFLRQIIYLGWPMDFFIQSISTGSLLLFSFFMITDPKTLPNNKLVRIIWCGIVAIISFYLTAFKFINGAPIFVLIFAQPLVPVLDMFFKSKKFEWKAVVHHQNLNRNEPFSTPIFR